MALSNVNGGKHFIPGASCCYSCGTPATTCAQTVENIGQFGCYRDCAVVWSDAGRESAKTGSWVSGGYTCTAEEQAIIDSTGPSGNTTTPSHDLCTDGYHLDSDPATASTKLFKDHFSCCSDCKEPPKTCAELVRDISPGGCYFGCARGWNDEGRAYAKAGSWMSGMAGDWVPCTAEEAAAIDDAKCAAGSMALSNVNGGKHFIPGFSCCYRCSEVATTCAGTIKNIGRGGCYRDCAAGWSAAGIESAITGDYVPGGYTCSAEQKLHIAALLDDYGHTEFTGYVVDTFCWNKPAKYANATFCTGSGCKWPAHTAPPSGCIDLTREPEKHTMECLRDVPECMPDLIMLGPSAADVSVHEPKYTFDAQSLLALQQLICDQDGDVRDPSLRLPADACSPEAPDKSISNGGHPMPRIRVVGKVSPDNPSLMTNAVFNIEGRPGETWPKRVDPPFALERVDTLTGNLGYRCPAKSSSRPRPFETRFFQAPLVSMSRIGPQTSATVEVLRNRLEAAITAGHVAEYRIVRPVSGPGARPAATAEYWAEIWYAGTPGFLAAHESIMAQTPCLPADGSCQLYLLTSGIGSCKLCSGNSAYVETSDEWHGYFSNSQARGAYPIQGFFQAALPLTAAEAGTLDYNIVKRVNTATATVLDIDFDDVSFFEVYTGAAAFDQHVINVNRTLAVAGAPNWFTDLGISRTANQWFHVEHRSSWCSFCEQPTSVFWSGQDTNPGRAGGAPECQSQESIVNDYFVKAFFQQNIPDAMQQTVNDASFTFKWSSTTPGLESKGLQRKFTGPSALGDFFAGVGGSVNMSTFQFANVYPSGAVQTPGPGIITLAKSCDSATGMPPVIVKQWAEYSVTKSGGVVDDAVNTVTYTFNAAGTKIQAVAVYVETPKYMEAFGLSDLPVPASPAPDSNNDVPSVVDDSGALTPTQAGWIGGVVGLVVGGLIAGAVIMFVRGRSTGVRQMTSSNIALVGQRRTTNEQMNPARQSIVDAMDKDGSAPLV